MSKKRTKAVQIPGRDRKLTAALYASVRGFVDHIELTECKQLVLEAMALSPEIPGGHAVSTEYRAGEAPAAGARLRRQ